MATAHLYVFSDACPSDWLVDGQEETWHTIVNVAFQSAPELQTAVNRGESHATVLRQDPLFLKLIDALTSELPSATIRKWKTGPGYRAAFCRAFSKIWPTNHLFVSGCSFQEGTLRASKPALLKSYNKDIGGLEERGIGFAEYIDDRGRPGLSHTFVNMGGYHELSGPENQVLVLLFMAWFVADQHAFYARDIRAVGSQFDRLALTVVSDKLSGDDDSNSISEQRLRWLIDPEHDQAPIVLTRSPQSDVFPGDLIVDNLAGWLNAAITAPSSEFGVMARSLAASGTWAGWHVLVQSVERLESVSAMSVLQTPESV